MADCGDRHVFPRDRFARLARVEVACEKSPGHKEDSHEAVVGATAFVWKSETTEQDNGGGL